MPPMRAGKPKSGIPVWVIILIAVGLFVVVLGGILAAVAVTGMSKYMAASKTAEAKTMVGAISRAAVSAYERDGLTAEPGSGSPNRLCATSTPVPASLARVRGAKYMPNPTPGADFYTGDATTGWTCLRFTIDTPMHYQYRYTQGSGYLVQSTAPGADGFEASAQGDIDGDGAPSTFLLTGAVGPNNTVKVQPSIYIEDELE